MSTYQQQVTIKIIHFDGFVGGEKEKEKKEQVMHRVPAIQPNQNIYKYQNHETPGFDELGSARPRRTDRNVAKGKKGKTKDVWFMQHGDGDEKWRCGDVNETKKKNTVHDSREGGGETGSDTKRASQKRENQRTPDKTLCGIVWMI